MRITEIFHSIQGESSHVGRPMTFVRLTGCNLRCVWCDSEYTFRGGESMSIDEVLDRVRQIGCPTVEITGGEPLLQKEVFDLIRQLADQDYEVLVETSGSIDTSEVDERARIILDLKCPGSGEADRNLWSNLDRLRDHDEVKFVIADRADFEWARDVIRDRQLERISVLMSPVWDSLELKALAEWILADRLNVRLQTQLHKHIWGADVQGV